MIKMKPRKQAPKITPSQAIAKRNKLAGKRIFIWRAMKTLKRTEPDLVAIFKRIPEQVELTRNGRKAVEWQLKLCAASAEMEKRRMCPKDWITENSLSFFAETTKGSATITIKNDKGKWKMKIQDGIML